MLFSPQETVFLHQTFFDHDMQKKPKKKNPVQSNEESLLEQRLQAIVEKNREMNQALNKILEGVKKSNPSSNS
jgi:hypothetical protein